MGGYGYLELTPTENRVAHLVLRRERKRNALCMAMRDELEQALNELEADDEVHGVVLRAAGDGIFCAGFDLKEGMATGGQAFKHRFREFFEACYLFEKPIVAAVDGPALGGGFDLALMADFLIASPRATFHHPEIAFGPVAITPLARFVTPARARELALLGEPLSAEEAHRLGIVHRLVDPAEVEPVAAALAEKLAARPLLALTLTKRAQLAGTVHRLLDADIQALLDGVADAD